jgi:hypothetical protein
MIMLEWVDVSLWTSGSKSAMLTMKLCEKRGDNMQSSEKRWIVSCAGHRIPSLYRTVYSNGGHEYMRYRGRYYEVAPYYSVNGNPYYQIISKQWGL